MAINEFLTIEERESIIKQLCDNLPKEMKESQQFLCSGYAYDYKTKQYDLSYKSAKTPKSIKKEANRKDIDEHGTFEEACKMLLKCKSYTGIGIDTSNYICCVDIDHVIKDNEIIGNEEITANQVKNIMMAFDSYTELSRSKTGIHIFFGITDELFINLSKLYIGTRGKGIEIYFKPSNHYIAITGNIFLDYRDFKRGNDTREFKNKTYTTDQVFISLIQSFKLHEKQQANNKYNEIINVSFESQEPTPNTNNEIIEAIQKQDLKNNTNNFERIKGNFKYFNMESQSELLFSTFKTLWTYTHNLKQICEILEKYFIAEHDGETMTFKEKYLSRHGKETKLEYDFKRFINTLTEEELKANIYICDIEKWKEANKMIDEKQAKIQEFANNSDKLTEETPKTRNIGNFEGQNANNNDIKYQSEQETSKKSVLEDTQSNFINSYFLKSLEDGKQLHKTYFNRLDKILNGGFDNDLIVIGAETGAGKTTFALQLMDQIAQNEKEQYFIYYSLEMTRSQITAKCINRISNLLKDNNNFKNNINGVIDTMNFENLNVLSMLNNYNTWQDNSERIAFDTAKNLYLKYANRIIIKEGFISERQEDGKITTHRTTITDIEEYIKRFIEETGKKPIIFIDYLQFLPNDNNKLKEYEAINDNVNRLKTIAITYNVCVIVISSLNRDKDRTQIDLFSFKGSGLIEYTANVVLSLDYGDNKNEETDKDKRNIYLRILKNRFGSIARNNAIQYEFLPSQNVFIELNDNDRDGTNRNILNSYINKNWNN